MASKQDYYKTLGVERTASQDEVQKAYRRLARRYHPDINQAPGAEDRFKALGEAYEVLKDPDKRKLYDRFGDNWRAASQQGADPGPAPGSGGFHAGNVDDFGDLFGSFFGARGRPGSNPFQSGPRRGADHKAQLNIALEDAYRGAAREITLSLAQGESPRRFKVNIPRGIVEGKVLRLASQGGQGTGGAPAGDLLIEIHIAPHPTYKVEGRDLVVSLPLMPWQAALGDRVQVPTLDGPVSMKVPPGVQGGQKLRLRGKGIPNPGRTPGDLYAQVEIEIPRQLSDKERSLYQSLAELSQVH